MRSMIALLAILAALAVSGCAGNREDVAATDAGPGVGAASGPPDWLLDASAARANVAGSAVLAMPPEDLAALDERIVTGADTQIMTGTWRAFAEYPGTIEGAACEGGDCRYGASGEITLEDHFFGADYRPVMEHRGVRLGQAFFKVTDEVVSDPEVFQDFTAYGGWMHYSTFVLQVAFYPDKGAPDSVRTLPYSIGRASGANPLTGSATWTGVALGVDLNRLFPDPDVLQGDAGIVYDFADASVDVTLDNFVSLRTGAAAGHRMEWTGIAVKDGAFSRGTHWDGEQVAGRSTAATGRRWAACSGRARSRGRSARPGRTAGSRGESAAHADGIGAHRNRRCCRTRRR